MNTLEQINALYPPPPLTLSIEQISVILGVSKGGLYNKLNESKVALNELPPIKKRLGRWVVGRKDLASWMDGKTEEPKPQVRMCRRGRPKKTTQFLSLLTFEIKRIEQLKIDNFYKAENALRNDLEKIIDTTQAKRLEML